MYVILAKWSVIKKSSKFHELQILVCPLMYEIRSLYTYCYIRLLLAFSQIKITIYQITLFNSSSSSSSSASYCIVDFVLSENALLRNSGLWEQTNGSEWNERLFDCTSILEQSMSTTELNIFTLVSNINISFSVFSIFSLIMNKELPSKERLGTADFWCRWLLLILQILLQLSSSHTFADAKHQ